MHNLQKGVTMFAKLRNKLFSLLLIFSLLLTACSTAVQITTDPTGADVEINGQPKGKTPLILPLSDFIGSSFQTRFRLPGYKDKYVELQKEFKAGTFVGGLFIWPFLLWSYGPEPTQTFILEKE